VSKHNIGVILTRFF